MARLGTLKDTWEEYKGWFFLLVSVYVLFELRGVFSALGGAATAAADAATGGLTKSATSSADKSKAKAASGGKVDYTAEQVATFRADAASLVEYFGRGSFSLESVFKDTASAFSLLKQRYSRLNLWDNQPWHYVLTAGKKSAQLQLAETKDSVKNTTNWRVLAPFYLELSGGHPLEADIRFYLNSSTQKAFLKWIL